MLADYPSGNEYEARENIFIPTTLGRYNKVPNKILVNKKFAHTYILMGFLPNVYWILVSRWASPQKGCGQSRYLGPRPPCTTHSCPPSMVTTPSCPPSAVATPTPSKKASFYALIT
jgi:hypothetical protein